MPRPLTPVGPDALAILRVIANGAPAYVFPDGIDPGSVHRTLLRRRGLARSWRGSYGRWEWSILRPGRDFLDQHQGTLNL